MVSEVENLLGFFYLIGWGFLFFYFFNVYRARLDYFLSSFYQIFYFVFLLIGATFASLGSYMYEIQKFGLPNGVFWLCLIFCVLSVESGWMGYRFAKSSSYIYFNSKLNSINLLFAHILIFMVLLMCLLLLLVYGSPFQYAVTRIQFWGEVAPKEFSLIRFLLIGTFPILASVLYFNKRSRIHSLFWGGVTVIYLGLSVAVLAEKFSLFIIYISSFMFVAAGTMSIKKINRLIPRILLMVLILVFFSAFVYYRAGLGFSFVFDRLALQAEVPWSVLQESSVVLIFGANYEVGNILDATRVVMDRYLPATVYAGFKESKTTLTGYMPSIIILYYGIFVAVILHIFVSFLIGWLQFKVVCSFKNREYFASLVTYYILFCVLFSWYVWNLRLLLGLVFFGVLILIYRLFAAPKGVRYKMSNS